jgi:hypothetical protein
MAVVSMMRFQGDADDLLRRVQEHVEPTSVRLSPKHGRLANIVARTGDGVLVINLWETEEGRHAMAAEPEIQDAVSAAGLPPPNFEGFEVVALRVTDRLAEVAEKD